MSGHGHVTPNADGSRARCGGPGMCPECAVEAGQLTRVSSELPVYMPGAKKPSDPPPYQQTVQWQPIMKFFEYRHLPPHLQAISQPCAELAASMDNQVGASSECTEGLRKLLEAKDCFVRACIDVSSKKREV